MKKLSLLLLLSVFVFCSCGDDDDDVKNEVVVSFENLLTEENSQFIADGTPNNQAFQETDFKDPKNLINFNHYYADWGSGYSFAGFSYMNITDNQTANSPAPITGKAKIGSVYIGVDSTDGEYGTPAILTILDTNYKLKGTWIANSTWAYMGMIQGDRYARAFKVGDWYKVTATGYDEAGNETGKAEILLANYKTDNDLPVKEWIWFDLTPLQNAVKVKFIPDSSDKNEYGMNTASYFCLDGITLIEK
jgi:hypothetical protein